MDWVWSVNWDLNFIWDVFFDDIWDLLFNFYWIWLFQ
jgi:hypothetical protein